jgi:UDP-N-acetylmuramate dehydrogenase
MKEMQVNAELAQEFARIPNVNVVECAPLKDYTRFGIGGPAKLFVEAAGESSFVQALAVARDSGLPCVVIGGGTNLIVSDAGFPGVVLRFTARGLRRQETSVIAEAGADLQALVDYTLDLGLKGIETMTGIPGSVGGAVYGNAGAYGHSLMERVSWVRFFDGEQTRIFSNRECQFHYRESVFKLHKNWIVFSTELQLDAAPSGDLRRIADDILKIRNEKYPPTMKCAGSIFKNLILAELPAAVQEKVPAKVIREGKVPSAYFLEQVGAKGIENGDIRVADYHANLIYNAGHGTARQVTEIIALLKSRVLDRFGLDLEEEVQYVGFDTELHAAACP